MEDPLINNLSDSQRNILNQFKLNLTDILTKKDTDFILIKFLRARNYNISKAEDLFREMHTIKQVYRFDHLLNTFQKPEAAEKYEFTSFIGFAKDGTIVRHIAIGKGDYLGYISSIDIFDLCLYCCFMMESDLKLQHQLNEKNGTHIHEVTYIFDLDGFCIQKLLNKSVLEMAFDLGKIVQEYYPEYWGNVFFVNVPSYFDTLYVMFKPILKLTVLERIQIASREHTPGVLLKYIDEDVLPASLGGKRVDSGGDLECKEFMHYGGVVPERYYLRNNRELLMPTDPGVTDIWIGARSTFDYALEVVKPDTTIRIQFRTENGSIHFRPYLKKFIECSENCSGEEEEKAKPASPPLRVQAHVASVDSLFVAPFRGTYIFRFSNAHSWLLSRRLIFRIQIIET